ncbi:hypothetical protein [Streptomyces tunisiensis]|uniref:hypothetical protein n=1 Tax=Streptomyces tunisiensis TaxID=948699 RepID=UPI00403D8775
MSGELGVVVLGGPEFDADILPTESVDPFLVPLGGPLWKTEDEVGQSGDVLDRLGERVLDLRALACAELILAVEDEPFARPPPDPAGVAQSTGMVDVQIELDAGLVATLPHRAQRTIATGDDGPRERFEVLVSGAGQACQISQIHRRSGYSHPTA